MDLGLRIEVSRRTVLGGALLPFPSVEQFGQALAIGSGTFGGLQGQIDMRWLFPTSTRLLYVIPVKLIPVGYPPVSSFDPRTMDRWVRALSKDDDEPTSFLVCYCPTSLDVRRPGHPVEHDRSTLA